METLIKVEGLKKKYEKRENNVLENINLKVCEGDFITIMGPSGSGKSTLLYAMSSLDSFDEGEIVVVGKNLKDLSGEEASDLRLNNFGFVFQEAAFLGKLTILDNIILPALYSRKDKKNLSIEDIKNRARQLMESLSIGEIENRTIKEVSGGQLQRASICRALINNPKILFLDEPTGALNSKTGEEVMDIFEGLNKEGITIILVTHDIKVAARGKRTIFIKDGRVKEDINYGEASYENKIKLLREKMTERGI